MTEEKVQLREEQITLLEKLAVVNEKMGLQPAMAKVLALLTVSDDPELNFEQIMETLNLSKGATSQAINHLLLVNRIDYKTRIGDRKRYFYSKIIGWRENFLEQVTKLKQLAAIHKEVLEHRPPETKEYNQSISDLIDFLEYLAEETPALYERFEKRKKG